MSWHISGSSYASCSCNVGCPCALGEMETTGSVGCSAIMAFDISTGHVDGTDVSGTKVAVAVDWPGALMGGNGTGRMYFDTAVSQQQRAALERVLTGKCGGVFEQVPSLFSKMLPPKVAPIRVQTGLEETSLTVGDFGGAVVKPMRGPSGDFLRLLHGAAAFRDDVVLAKGIGSRWRDPEMRQWESGGYAEQADFNWSG